MNFKLSKTFNLCHARSTKLKERFKSDKILKNQLSDYPYWTSRRFEPRKDFDRIAEIEETPSKDQIMTEYLQHF